MKLYAVGLSGLAVAGVVFIAAFTSLAPARWITTALSTSTGDAYVTGDVVPISPKISGYLVEVNIRDNQPVKAGDVLFRIDDSDYRASEEQASAAVASRRAILDNLASQIELQNATVEQALAAQRGAEAEAHRTAANFTRIRELAGRGWVSQAVRDQAEADDLQAHAKVAGTRANVAAARRQEDVLVSQRPRLLADIDAAVAADALARIALENTVVRAPSDGWVGARQARVGQYVRPGTLLVAIVPEHVWIVANFKETQIPAVRVGYSVRISIDGIPGTTFSGRVDSLSPASGAQFALLPPDNATGNFTRIVQRIPVKITLDANQPGLDHLRLGMSATVALASGDHRIQTRQVPALVRP